MTMSAWSNRFVYLDELSNNIDEALAFAKALSFRQCWYRKFDYKSLVDLTDDGHKLFKSKLISNGQTLIGFNISPTDIHSDKLIGLTGYYRSKYLSIEIADKKSYANSYDALMIFAKKMSQVGICVVCPYYWWLMNYDKQFSAYSLDARIILNHVNVSIRDSVLRNNNFAIIDTIDVTPGYGTQWLGDGRLDFSGCIKDLGEKVMVGCAHSMVVRHGNSKVDNMRTQLGRLERFYD